jgi:uncharacterized protein YndB with AHSA1/START domain
MKRESPYKLTIKKLLPASREEVFAAWTDPESLKQWMDPGNTSVPLVQVDLREGGSFRIDMQTESGYHVHTGEYLEIKPPEKLVFTWISEFTDQSPSRVTLEFFERGDQTELLLTHEQLPSEDAVKGHTRGWMERVDFLADYLKNL